MGLSVVITDRQNWGSKFANFVTITFDSSYAAGGEPVVPGDFGLTSVDEIIPFGVARNVLDGVLFEYLPSSGVLKAFTVQTGTPDVLREAPGTTDLSAVTVRALAIGKS